MRHRKDTCKLNRNSSHRRCLFANMLKSLILKERIVTTLPKAKALRRFADQMVTLAKKDDLASRRQAFAKLMVRYNKLTSKQKRQAKEGDQSAFNDDRKVIKKLFEEIGPRFSSRNGGYTRVLKLAETRSGDNGSKCVIEYLPE